jgi:hypothetical protein
MNQDQVTNLIQTVGKMAGAAAIAHGVGNSTMWEAIVGAVVAIAAWYWSHKSNATTPNTNNPNPILK